MAKEKARCGDQNRNENEFLQEDSGLGVCNTRERRRRGSTRTSIAGFWFCHKWRKLVLLI